MVNILRSLLLSLIGLSPFASISVIFIVTMIVGVGPDHVIAGYFGEQIINSQDLAETGDDFEGVAGYLFKFFYELNIALLSLTVVMTLGWSIGSHYLNIDAPGKAKIYALHWIIFTGIFIIIMVGIIFWFTQTSAYRAEQYLSTGGKFQIMIGSLALYTIMYYVGVLLGTARFARSSVLLANKLPGGF